MHTRLHPLSMSPRSSLTCTSFFSHPCSSLPFPLQQVLHGEARACDALVGARLNGPLERGPAAVRDGSGRQPRHRTPQRVVQWLERQHARRQERRSGVVDEQQQPAPGSTRAAAWVRRSRPHGVQRLVGRGYSPESFQHSPLHAQC